MTAIFDENRDGVKANTNRSTRMLIGDTISKLMEKEELADITISKITKTACISRMTFYRYYDTKEAALIDYLSEVIYSYLRAANEKGIHSRLHTFENLRFALDFFSSYDTFMLQMERNGYYNILIDGVNQFLGTYASETFHGHPYHLYFYAGALLNVFLEWLKNGKKESSETIAKMILSY